MAIFNSYVPTYQRVACLIDQYKLVGGDWNMTIMNFHSGGNGITSQLTQSYFSEGLKAPTRKDHNVG